MVGSSNTLRKIGGKLAVNTFYVLTADVTIDSFVFKRSTSRKLLIIIHIVLYHIRGISFTNISWHELNNIPGAQRNRNVLYIRINMNPHIS